jgi:tyrosinase
MPSRRNFVLAAAATLATPYISRSSAVAATTLVRRDVMDMPATDPFFSDYANAVKKMHALGANDGRNWIAQAKIHADNCHHGEVEFLHWHRHYIRFFEKICANMCGNPNFALPYWNWSKNSGRYPAPFFDLPELNVEHWNDPGKYNGKAWGPIDTVGRRGLDKTHGLLDDPVRGGSFTLTNVNRIKQLPSIDLFHPSLEGQPHNNGHVVAGATKTGKTGHIGDGLSPLDPIFWLHHCMVDRVWAEWQRSPALVTPDPKADYSGQFFEADGTSAKANSSSAMDIANLDYTYDIFQTAPAVTAAARVAVAAPVVIGSAANTTASRANLETAINVSIPTLDTHAKELRAQEAAGETSRNRLLAKLSDVKGPAANDLLVNVFVNCPYLSPSTPYSDPHYAGTFSFFGAQKMQDMPGMNSRTYVVDITTAVREAGFAPDKIKLQFMPVSAAAGAESKSSFYVGKIEILSI